jgi:osmotically-inducible protein OsmY
MRSGIDILEDVKDEISWEPSLSSELIGVSVNNGMVTLSGTVDSAFKRSTAERAAMRVWGVTRVVNNLEVNLASVLKRSDDDIKEAVLNAIKWNSAVDENKIKVTVKGGWVLLEGQVDWDYQRARIKDIAEELTGVVGVNNQVTISTKEHPAVPSSKEIRSRINAALRRNIFLLNGEKIDVEVSGSVVTLSGSVRSLREKNDAAYAAWSAPGVTHVENELEVHYEEAVA